MTENERVMELLKEHVDTMLMIENNAKKFNSMNNLDEWKKIAKENIELIDYAVLINNELIKYAAVDWETINESYKEFKKLRDLYSGLLD